MTTNPVPAVPNGAAAVANYNQQVEQTQKLVADLTARLTAANEKLAALLASPVVLHK